MTDLAELIEEFCGDNEDCEFYAGYSGRNMFGRKCVGIVLRGSDTYRMLMELCDFLHERGVENVSSAVGGIHSDEMGLDTILYFPYVSA